MWELRLFFTATLLSTKSNHQSNRIFVAVQNGTTTHPALVHRTSFVNGTVFIVAGLWQLINACSTYFKSRRKYAKPFQARVYYTTWICGKEYLLEPWVKMIFCIIGVTWEFLTRHPESYGDKRIDGPHYQQMIVHMHYQHMTMFSAFAVGAFFEILHHYRFHLPPNALYPIYTLVFGTEGLLFLWHYPEHSKPLLGEIHMFQVYIIGVILVMGYAELAYQNHILPNITRIYLILLQGFWLTTADSITDPLPGFPVWSYTDPFQTMSAAILFAFVMAMCLTLVMAVWFLMACRFRMVRLPVEKGKTVEYNSDTKPLLETA